jgi:hypothetical protein
MVRSIIMILIAGSGFVFVGAHQSSSSEAQKTPPCVGYSVIEADKGIDCNGDTIKLVKVNGFFQRAPLSVVR